MKLLLPFFLSILHSALHIGETLVTYKSTLPLNAPNPFAGLRLLKESVKKDTNFTDGITICMRFNYRQLGDGIYILGILDETGKRSIDVIAGYQQTFFNFENFNWIVKDLIYDSFIVWSTNRWHSLCTAFDRAKSHITFVKVISILLFPNLCVFVTSL